MNRDNFKTKNKLIKGQNSTLKEFLRKIKNKEACIGIIGLGYVGLPLSLAFAKAGFKVTGFDVDKSKVEMLNAGKSYIKHIPNKEIENHLSDFFATTNLKLLSEQDAIIICVPTPLTPNREPDLTYITSTASQIAQYLKIGQLISLESTTYPGTTEEVLLPMFDKTGFKVGRDYFLVFSPEREDPANPNFTTTTIPKVIGGVTENCLKAGETLYSAIVQKTVPVSSPRVAEATKLLENIYRSVNIAMVNELKILFERMEIDIFEVIEAAKTKPFGFQPFYPGPGLGGHCIPIDPFYLSWKARSYDTTTRFIELAGEINTSMPYYVIQKVTEALNSKQKPLKGAKVLILGMAYKKNVDDMRESPSLKLMELLEKGGAKVDYHDPFIPRLPKTRHYNFKKSSIEFSPKNLKKYDLILISTDHDFYRQKADLILKNSNLIVDTRNVLPLTPGKVFRA